MKDRSRLIRRSGKTRPLALLTAAFIAWVSVAAETAIEVTGAWSRATPPGANVGAVYLTLDTAGEAARLVAIESPVAERVELHEMRHEGGAMRMRKLGPPFTLDGAEPLVLEPGGLHLMLIGLKQPLVAGDHYTLKFVFEQAGPVSVDVEVRSPTGE